MSTHNIFFHGEIIKILICILHLIRHYLSKESKMFPLRLGTTVSDTNHLSTVQFIHNLGILNMS